MTSACSQAPTGQGTTGGTTQGQADPNGELTLNTGSEPDTIDPQKASFVNEIGQASFVFEGLMTFDSKTSKAVPAAAASMPKVSADGLKYTYTLRDGLKYSDGAPLTAKNFEYSFLRGCDPTAAGDYAFVFYIIVGCEAYNTMDASKATPAELSAARAKVGVIEVATGQAGFDQALLVDRPTGLVVLPSPPKQRPPGINEFVFSDTMRNMLDRLREHFDYVIVDSPPLVPLIDARALGDIADRIILTIRWDSTPRDVLAQAMETIAPDYEHLLGTVLTRVDMERLRDYDYYRSSSYVTPYTYLGQPRLGRTQSS